MPVRMLGNKVGVEKLGKSASTNGLFALPEDTNSVGVIRYKGENVGEQYQLGAKVYFGDKRQQVRMEGKDIQVMEVDNLLAIAEE